MTSAAMDARRRPLAAERLYLIVLALVGAGIATYLAMFQLRLTSAIWDPVFGAASSESVLRSGLARSLPVPDAGLGAIAYLLEAVLGALTGARDLPAEWLRIAFAAVVVGLAAAGVVLIVVQIAFVHALCALCLASAAISWINLTLSRDDIAVGMHLVHTTMRRKIA